MAFSRAPMMNPKTRYTYAIGCPLREDNRRNCDGIEHTLYPDEARAEDAMREHLATHDASELLDCVLGTTRETWLTKMRLVAEGA